MTDRKRQTEKDREGRIPYPSLFEGPRWPFQLFRNYKTASVNSSFQIPNRYISPSNLSFLNIVAESFPPLESATLLLSSPFFLSSWNSFFRSAHTLRKWPRIRGHQPGRTLSGTDKF